MEYIGVIYFRTVLADFLLQLILVQTLDWLDYNQTSDILQKNTEFVPNYDPALEMEYRCTKQTLPCYKSNTRSE